jgi:colanic acid biosynthesis glycosyl transferase WcaI
VVSRKCGEISALIVFVNRFFAPDISATSQMLSDLVHGLTARQLPITVLTSRLRYDRIDAPLPVCETWQGARVLRLWSTRFGRASLMGRSLDYLSFYLSAMIAVLAHGRSGHVLVALTDPPMIGTVLHVFARMRGMKVVHWLQDIFPEVAQALLPAAQKSIAMRVAKHLRNASLKRSDALVVLGERMAEHVAAQGVAADKIHIINNWADESGLAPIAPEQNLLRRAWGLTDQLVIGYSGNLGRAHEFETIVHAIFQSQNAANLKFLFIGQGAQLAPLKDRLSALGLLERVHFEGYQAREKLSESLSAADVHLVSLQPELEGLIVPSKLYGALAVGRPVIFIGDLDGEVARVLARNQCGQSVAVGDATALAQSVQSYVRGERLQLESAAARKAFLQNYTFALAAQRWSAVLQTLESCVD